MPHSIPLEQAFWSKVDKRGSDECWPWTGYHNHRGYARFSRRDKGGPSKGHPAGRMAWVLTYGKPFPAGRFACHRCDNPGCVNPAHIFPGTPLDNMRDMVAKGRHRSPQRTHCRNGHAYPVPDDGKRRRSGARCIICYRAIVSRRAAKKLAERAEARRARRLKCP
jgi:hypothetical protein